MQFEKYICDYIVSNGSNTLFRNSFEKTAFIVAAEMMCQIVEQAGGHDFHGAVANTYRKLFEVVLKPLFDSQENLIKALENQMKYGTRITITTEQMEKLLEESENDK